MAYEDSGSRELNPDGCSGHWGGGERHPLQDPSMGRLVRTIEAEIIPRLMLAHRLNGPEVVRTRSAPGPEEIEELARIVVSHDVAVACAYVEAIQARDLTVDRIYLDLLAPVARQLGTLWEEDRCSFTDVTVGLLRLQQVIHELSPRYREEFAQAAECEPRRVLLMVTPGEQHTFGIGIVAEFFRRAGWETWHEMPRTEHEMLHLVRDRSFTLIGLSASVDTRLDGLANTIGRLRKASCNHSVGVLVGGLPFLGYPERVERVGADGTAMDGRLAVKRAREIVAEIADNP
jgi:MerR family transcriptional regulator, light-induced transcriptional regulator